MINHFKEFFHALVIPFRGIKILRENRVLWMYSLIPIVIGIIFNFLNILSIYNPNWGVSWTWNLLENLYKYSILVSIIVVQGFIILMSPLLDLIGNRFEKILRQNNKSEFDFIFNFEVLKTALFTIIESLKFIILKSIVYFIALIIYFIPHYGRYFAFLLGVLVIGIDFLDYPLSRKKFNLREKMEYFKNNKSKVFGYSISSGLLLAIPGIGGIFIVPCALGATLLLFNARKSSDEIQT